MDNSQRNKSNKDVKGVNKGKSTYTYVKEMNAPHVSLINYFDMRKHLKDKEQTC